MTGPRRPDDAPDARAVHGQEKLTDPDTWLEPVTQQFIDALASTPPLQTFLATEARATLARAQLGPVGKPRASIEDVTFPVGPGGAVQVRITRPPRSGQALPAVMLFHGGCSVIGDKHTYDRLMREIAVGAGAAVVFVDYGQAFENPYPAAVEQAYAATRYVVDQASRLNVDANRLAVIGDGIGGNIATMSTRLAKERRGPKIDLQILLYPMTGVDFETPSYRRYADGPWLTRAAMKWLWDAYTIHDFVLLDALADTPAVRSAIAQIITALKCAFD